MARLVAFLFLFAVLLLLAGCAGTVTPPATAPASAGAQQASPQTPSAPAQTPSAASSTPAAPAQSTEPSLYSIGAGKNPRISGDNIVFARKEGLNYHVYLYNIKDKSTKGIATANYSELPAISGNNIVWLDMRGVGSSKANSVYYYGIASGQEKAIGYGDTYLHCPAVSTDYAVWKDSPKNGEVVYLYNLASGTGKVISTQGPYPGCPDVEGDYVAWSQLEQGPCDKCHSLMLYKISTGATTKIISTDVSINPEVSLRGGKIGYVQGDSGKKQAFVYDIASGTSKQLSTAESVKEGVSFGDGYAVWADYRNGKADIYGYDFAAQKEFQLTSSAEPQLTPDTDGGLAVYKDDKDGNVYVARLEP